MATGYCTTVRSQWSIVPATVSLPSFLSYTTQPGVTIWKIAGSLNAIIDHTDTVEGGAVDQLSEFRQFWQARVVANDSSGMSMFARYSSAPRSAAAARMSGWCSGSGFQGAWQSIGPDSMAGQTGGKIDVVWADTDHPDTILAGSQGGLFKSVDGGANWHYR